MIALVALLAAASPTAADAELVSSLVAAAATNDARLDVLSAADVRNAVDLEAQRAILGCDETSCLLEVAGAMDARLVVHGTLGTLGNLVILTLSVFDTANATAIGRVVVQEPKIEALADRIPDATAKLLEKAPEPTGGTRIRTVVLDVKLAATTALPAGGNTAPVVVEEPARFPFLGAGIGAAAVGVAGVGAALVVEAYAAQQRDAIVTQKDAVDAERQRKDLLAPAAGFGYAAGAVGVASAIVFFVAGALE